MATIPTDSGYIKSKADLIKEAFGSDNPQQYGGTFKQAYEGLGQKTSNPEYEGFVRSGTQELAEAFVGQYYQRNGKLPDSSQVSNFVSKSLTGDYANNYLQGNISRGQTSQLATDYLDQKALSGDISDASKPSLQNQYDDIFNRLETSAPEKVRRLFAPQRQRAIEEEAASGRLYSGVSKDRSSAIGNVDQLEANALSDTISNILGQKASGTLDIAKINQNQQGLNQQAQQYLANLGLARDTFNRDTNYQNKSLQIAREIGAAQAKQKQPGGLDYANTALQGAGTAAMIAKMFMGA